MPGTHIISGLVVVAMPVLPLHHTEMSPLSCRRLLMLLIPGYLDSEMPLPVAVSFWLSSHQQSVVAVGHGSLIPVMVAAIGLAGYGSSSGEAVAVAVAVDAIIAALDLNCHYCCSHPIWGTTHVRIWGRFWAILVTFLGHF